MEIVVLVLAAAGGVALGLLLAALGLGLAVAGLRRALGRGQLRGG